MQGDGLSYIAIAISQGGPRLFLLLRRGSRVNR